MPTRRAFRFHAGARCSTRCVLADEINRAPPKTQSALLEAMEERQVSMDGTTRKLPDPFFVIATQNPVEQIGAYPLPESQLDRFLLAIELGLSRTRQPSANSWPEATGASTSPGCPRWPTRRRCWRGSARRPTSTSPRRCSTTSRRCSPPPAATPAARPTPGCAAACRPRAGLLLLAAARAWALINGRPMALPEDVQAVFPAVAGHRLAGGARAGALQAQALLRAVALP